MNDLTNKIAPFLDPHLLIPLLSHSKSLDVYEEKDLEQALVSSLKNSLLVELPFGRFPSSVEESHKAKSTELLSDLSQKCHDLLEIIQDESQVDELIATGSFTAEYLKENSNINEDTIESFFQYAKVLFQSGMYEESNLILFYFRALCPNQEQLMSCYWGKIAAQIMMFSNEVNNEQLTHCWEDFETLIKLIDEKSQNEKVGSSLIGLESMQLRTWMLHWSLFILFKQKENITLSETNETKEDFEELPKFLNDKFVELFTQDKHLITIQLNAPWLLRYLVVGVLFQIGASMPMFSEPNSAVSRSTTALRQQKQLLRTITRVVSQESYNFQDPITRFLVALLVDYDFSEARSQLQQCEKVFKGDYFLDSNVFKSFKQSAEVLFFETYCKVHSRLSIKWLGEQLGMSYEEAEHWVVTLITVSRLDAKIDSEKGCVVMGFKGANPYQQTIDATKDLAFRTFQLVSTTN